MHYVMPFLVAMIVTTACLPLLVKIAARWRIVDHPGERKVHSVPIPRIGGLAMAVGVCIAAAAAIELQGPDRWFLCAAAVLVTFGALDDRFNLDYRLKLVGQLLAVLIVVMLGDVRIATITLADRVWLPESVSLVLTIFFLVGITNAINLADGLDGLAGGTTFLCLCAVAMLSSVSDQGSCTALSLAFAGAVLGFLRFNTYPASVFMGDSGSQLLGFAVGVLSVRATQSTVTQVSAAIPMLLLALPILDTLSVMVQRIDEGRSPFSADKNHIHHKLLALGFGHHEAVMVIYIVQALLFTLAYFMRFESDLTILFVLSAFFVLSIAGLQIAARSGWRLGGANPVSSESRLSKVFTGLLQPKLLPRISIFAIATAISLYAMLIVLKAAVLSSDVRALLMGLLAVTCGLLLILRAGPLSFVEKAALYVTATVLVYLDAMIPAPDHIMSILTWTAVSIAAAATAIRLRLLSDRRFQLTPLDLIVLFMALVVPSLPGSFSLPLGGALTIAKLLIVLYAIEILVSRTEGRTVWLRIGIASVLAGLVIRPFIAI